jgi:hypothetical protein
MALTPTTRATALAGEFAKRGIGSSTLMRQIIEDWVRANRESPAPDQLGELIRYLDAARQVAASLAHDKAA